MMGNVARLLTQVSVLFALRAASSRTQKPLSLASCGGLDHRTNGSADRHRQLGPGDHEGFWYHKGPSRRAGPLSWVV
jgi:hypothetical protein